MPKYPPQHFILENPQPTLTAHNKTCLVLRNTNDYTSYIRKDNWQLPVILQKRSSDYIRYTTKGTDGYTCSITKEDILVTPQRKTDD
jgi:hypothetical protein